MELNFFGERLARLRAVKGVSARDMSLSLGQSANYINKIENKKAFPSMTAFYHICDYLGVTQIEFFDEGNNDPKQVRELINDIKSLDSETLTHIGGIVKELVNAKK